jgi:hypothetical protein
MAVDAPSLVGSYFSDFSLGIATDFIQYPTTFIIFEFSSAKDADVRKPF